MLSKGSDEAPGPESSWSRRSSERHGTGPRSDSRPARPSAPPGLGRAPDPRARRSALGSGRERGPTGGAARSLGADHGPRPRRARDGGGGLPRRDRRGREASDRRHPARPAGGPLRLFLHAAPRRDRGRGGARESRCGTDPPLTARGRGPPGRRSGRRRSRDLPRALLAFEPGPAGSPIGRGSPPPGFPSRAEPG